jgi:uncharacterized membrane protein (DUF4010 family)
MPELALPASVIAVGEALLIGFLIGAQREASQGEGHPGVRDFVLIALIGSISGLVQNPWLTGATLLSITAMLGVFYFQVKQRSGITTEMAALATYSLGFLAASPGNTRGETLAIGISIVVVAFLEAKRALHKLVRESVTESEFNDTLRFLAIIFIIYPILPDGEFGPFGFLSPRRIWLFVILVSSVSYAGYFLAKFLGARRGLKLTGLLGGLTSTTAATLSFASLSKEDPASRLLHAQAAVVANIIQFPRVLVLLLAVSPALAKAALLPLAAMTVAGLGAGLLAGRSQAPAEGPVSLGLKNPFRLWPALQFGAVFGLVLFASKAAQASFGGQALYWTSSAAGSLDVDAVTLSIADLLAQGGVTTSTAIACILLGLLTNAVVKTGISFYAGAQEFARRVTAGFAVMFVAGAAGWWLTLY